MRTIRDTRSELAAALSTIAGVSGFEEAPSVIQALMAWPRWVSSAPIGQCSAERVWEVIVTLPGAGDQATVTHADDMESALAEALEQVDNAAWTLAEPVLLNTGTPGDTVPALRFRVVTSS